MHRKTIVYSNVIIEDFKFMRWSRDRNNIFAKTRHSN